MKPIAKLIIYLFLYSLLVYPVSAAWYVEEFGGSVTVEEESPITTLTIVNTTVTDDDTFILQVNCSPADFIHSWEFSIEFDETKLQANNVTEGNFFEPLSTMFNDGTIFNNNGTIQQMYCLTVGDYNVSENGTCINISFTAIDYGEAFVRFWYNDTVSEPGVTNATAYVPLNVYNGSVTINQRNVSWISRSFGGSVEVQNVIPYVYDEEPANESTDELISGIRLLISVVDYQGDNFNITWSTNATSWTMYNSSCSNGTYSQFITWATNENTIYWWTVCVNDTDGNWNNNTFHFTTAEYAWSSWSSYWKIGQTSIYDVTLTMDVDVNDLTSVTFHYGETGDPGWIPQDLNEDGEIDHIDVSGIANHYGEDYT